VSERKVGPAFRLRYITAATPAPASVSETKRMTAVIFVGVDLNLSLVSDETPVFKGVVLLGPRLPELDSP
jgi:hypothetical protein